MATFALPGWPWGVRGTKKIGRSPFHWSVALLTTNTYSCRPSTLSSRLPGQAVGAQPRDLQFRSTLNAMLPRPK